MAGSLCVIICSVGLMNLVAATLVKPYIYTAGSSPGASSLELHGISSFAHGLPGHEDSTERRTAVHHGHVHVPNAEGGHSHQHPPAPGKWCSVVHNRVVTYASLCKTEKYVIRSDEPCPPGTSDCQKTMYRLAQKPVYELKRKFVTSLEWKCCPGYTGSLCDYADPNAIHIPLAQASQVEASQEHPDITEVKEIIKSAESQESLLANIQNDIHQAASHLMELQNSLQHNTTTTLPNTHNESDAAAGKDNGEIDDRLREVFLPHVESFLKAHFNPMWNSFNKSLQNLNSMVKNLSESVEANRRRLDLFLENTVPKRDLYEMGTKFESKIQENVDKLEQLKQEMDNQFHTQQTIIHYNLTMFKADTDMKLKRNMKMQQTQYSFLNLSISDLRQGQEQIQDDLLDLSQNITMLCNSKEEDVTSITAHQINETFKEHKKEISELLTELDIAFDNISTLEKWIKDLRTRFFENSSRVQTQFMEKSLIMEEFKEHLQQQIKELNFTIASIQEGNDELFNDCDCHKMNSEILSIMEIQRNLSHQLRDLLYKIEDLKRKEGSSKISLQNSVEDLSLELQLNRQALTAQQEQGRKLTLTTSKLESQTKNFTEDVSLMRMDNEQIHNHIRHLDNSFSSLLEDAIRHERVLEALLGEEALDLFSEDIPDTLQVSLVKIYEMLNQTLERLDKQQIITDSINDRLHFLEMDPQEHNSPATTAIFNVEQHSEEKSNDTPFQQANLAHMEPSHDAARDADESEYSDVGILKKDIMYLSEKINELESHFADGQFYSNDTIEAKLQPLIFSITSVKADLAKLGDFYNRHVELFHKLFGNFEALLSSNVTLDVTKIQSVIDKKFQKNLKVVETQNHKKGKKQGVEKWQSDTTSIPHQGTPVAFSSWFSKGAEGSSMIKFNDVVLNYGNVFSPEDGHFTAPYSGVYAFAISVDFVPGNARAYLFFGGRQMLIFHNSSPQPAESLKQQFAIVELKKDDKVWLELLQGSIKKDVQGTSLSGFLIFKT
ncbi:multimerin-2 [Gastrophryne carolinensis]